jgi:predicted SprT family Zn-dependent metalloprotease
MINRLAEALQAALQLRTVDVDTPAAAWTAYGDRSEKTGCQWWHTDNVRPNPKVQSYE